MKQNGQMQSERTAFVSNKKSGQMPLLSIHFVPNTRCEYLQPRISDYREGSLQMYEHILI